MHEVRIEHPHNEASALVAIHDHALLDALGFELAFWIASDEKPAREAIAALGRTKDGEWNVAQLTTRQGTSSTSKPAEDCETIARAGAWIYVFGSQFGSKKGILEPKRHFVIRFNESQVRNMEVEIDLARAPFVLHRLINDALHARNIELIARNDDFIENTRKLARSKKKAWRKLVQKDDHPINVEGAAFLPNGHLLLGLRYPSTAEGQPILVEVERIDALFEGEEPRIASVWVIENAGAADAPAGVRELDARGAAIHVITGALDNPGVPTGARNEHIVVQVPKRRSRNVVRLKAKRVRRLARGSNVEGLAVQDDGRVWYVHDDEQIRLAVAKL
ncbi:MAG TPA: hypothetical protein VF846_15140 [Thermoanaerobaculia bacterium]|jgi:hypothetical protein